MSNPDDTTSSSEIRCPVCDKPGTPIMYGLPTYAAFEAEERGELVIGGCTPNEAETHRCPDGHSFSGEVDQAAQNEV